MFDLGLFGIIFLFLFVNFFDSLGMLIVVMIKVGFVDK